MSEVQYVWADPRSPSHQVALSSLVGAMHKLKMYAITRWVSRDKSESKMGVLHPCRFDNVDCFLWVQVCALFVLLLLASCGNEHV
jgi:ATP-dependent DNA helicase 2 subunit 2